MLWKCTVCGMTVEGNDAPDKCPKCGAPKEKFVQLSKEEQDKVYAAERTNDIHMEMIHLCDQIFSLCKEGIDIKLDPPCVDNFTKAKDEVYIIKQRAKAEIAGHIGKGKW